MSELDDALARLDAAVTRLEAAASSGGSADDERVKRLAEALAERVDNALGRLERLLHQEG